LGGGGGGLSGVGPVSAAEPDAWALRGSIVPASSPKAPIATSDAMQIRLELGESDAADRIWDLPA
jgi:hypothetical protein